MSISRLLTPRSLGVFFLLLTSCLVSTAASAQSVLICMDSTACNGPDDTTKTNLQAAFDYITTTSKKSRPAYLYLSTGLHKSPGWTRTIQHENWREACSLKTAYTGFRLRGRRSITVIEGGSNVPDETIIWAEVPDHVLTSPGSRPNIKVFHGIALDDNDKYYVAFKNLSLVSDGGYTDNGAGDATLYVKDSIASLHNTLVLANKTASNCLRLPDGTGHPAQIFYDGSQPIYHDQEGIVVDGGQLSLKESAIGGNVHTGVMLLNGAQATVGQTLVKGNGWDGGHFQNAHNGHGITSFYDQNEASCLDGDTRVNVQSSQIFNNTGSGVYLRGSFDSTYQTVSFNDFAGNSGYGFLMDGSWGGGFTTMYNGSGLTVRHNDFGSGASTRYANLELFQSSTIVYDDPNASIGYVGLYSGSAMYYYAPSGTGTSWDGSALWTRLLSVLSDLASEPRSCP